MTTPSHETFREQLLDLVYGELPRREALALRRHLEACAACREELARMEGTRSLLSALSDAPAPEGGERILLAAAREAVQEAARARRPRRLAWLVGAPIGAVAAVVLAVVTFRVLTVVRHPALVESAGEYSAAPAPPPSTPAPDEVARTGQAKARLAAEEAERSGVAGAVAAARPAPAEPAREPERRERLAQRAAPPAAVGDAAPEAKSAWSREADRRPPATAKVEAPAPLAGVEAAAGEERRAAPAGAPVAALARGAVRREDAVARSRRLEESGRLRISSATFTGCPGESFREVAVDEAGRVVRYVRRGLRGGVPDEVQLYYGEDGALEAVRYRVGGEVHEVRLDPAAAAPRAEGVPPAAFEPRRAEDAQLGAPPRCAG